jgi:hypothetical protein
VGLALAATGVASLSCEPTPRAQYRNRLEQTAKPSVHAVHSERLENVMEEMNALAYDRMNTEIALNLERRDRLNEIARLAGRIAESAHDIPEATAGVALSAGDRELLVAMSESLYAEAMVLQRQAQRNLTRQLSGTWDRITSICTSCHQEFRLPPPPIGAKPVG